MKKTSHLLAITLLAAGFALPVAAQTTPALEVNPETQTGITGTTVELTIATTPPAAGRDIDVERIAGPNDEDGGLVLDGDANWDMTCTTEVTGTCVVRYDGGPVGGTDTIIAWIDGPVPSNPTVEADQNEGAIEATMPGNTAEPDNTDVVTVTWQAQPADAPTLDVEPEAPVNPPGGSQQLTATAMQGGGPAQNVNVDFLIETGTGSGPGSHMECPTGPDGTCFVTYTGPAAPATNRVRSWIDTNDNDLPDEADVAEAEADEDNDGTDAVQLRWANEAPVLDLKPEQGFRPPGSPHTIDAELKNNFGQPLAGKVIGVLARSGPNINTVHKCTTVADGTCQVTFPGAASGKDEYLGWMDDNNNGLAEASEADLAEGRNEGTQAGTTSEPDKTDVVENEWVDLVIDVETEQVSENTGQERVLTATVTNTSGDPQAGHDVNFEIESGPNKNLNNDEKTADLTCTTDTDGTCTVRYSGTNEPGVDLTRAWLDRDKNKAVPGEADGTEGRDEGTDAGRDPEPDITDVVETTWETPPPPPEGCVGTPEGDILIGTDGDDDCKGLAGDDTIRTGGGNDIAKGGAGEDLLSLGSGDDSGKGGPGDDKLRGGPGDDDLAGGGGGDRVLGGSGNDRCSGERRRGCER
ncbi:MAG TPA: hypothetical protein VGB51_00165 [Actinomycetota bacterium]